MYLSSVSASLYACSVRKPISPISPRARSHVKNVDQEKNRCKMNREVKSKLDCQAWNLLES